MEHPVHICYVNTSVNTSVNIFLSKKYNRLGRILFSSVSSAFTHKLESHWNLPYVYCTSAAKLMNQQWWHIRSYSGSAANCVISWRVIEFTWGFCYIWLLQFSLEKWFFRFVECRLYRRVMETSHFHWTILTLLFLCSALQPIYCTF